DVDEEAVAQAVAEAAGTWVKVAERRPGLDRDARVEVAIAEDRMSATVVLARPLGGKPAGVAEIEAALRAAGVTAGWDQAAIARLAENPVYGEPATVARGSAPERGQDGRLEVFLPELSTRPAERDDGTVDYREIVVAHAVSAGDAVGRLHPPTEGKDGYDVAG